MHPQKGLIVFVALLILATVSNPAFAQEPKDDTEKTVESPSPDDRFAFLNTKTPDQRTLDLIEKKSGKILLRIVESDEGSNELSTHVLWASDSKRFAITETFHNRRMNDLAVYSRVSGSFRKSKLPELPEAKLPNKLGRDKDHFWHMNVLDYKTFGRWLKDKSLAIEIETTLDGNENFATAKRKVVLGFTRSGAGKILKSTQKVTSHQEK